jgi:K+-transporting ATPase ATPase A chain
MLWPASIPKKEQGWLAYAFAMIVFSIVGLTLLYACCGCRPICPQPAGLCRRGADLAFNTAVSFVTNTNWQNYGGETTLSHFSQMAGLTVQNFLSAATGIALAVALTRAFAVRRPRRSAISGST